MIIPYQSLAETTLDAVIEAFVLQEGTEYGAQEVSLAHKITQVKQQLKNKTAVLIYSELHQTVTILPSDKVQMTMDVPCE